MTLDQWIFTGAVIVGYLAARLLWRMREEARRRREFEADMRRTYGGGDWRRLW